MPPTPIILFCFVFVLGFAKVAGVVWHFFPQIVHAGNWKWHVLQNYTLHDGRRKSELLSVQRYLVWFSLYKTAHCIFPDVLRREKKLVQYCSCCFICERNSFVGLRLGVWIRSACLGGKWSGMEKKKQQIYRLSVCVCVCQFAITLKVIGMVPLSAVPLLCLWTTKFKCFCIGDIFRLMPRWFWDVKFWWCGWNTDLCCTTFYRKDLYCCMQMFWLGNYFTALSSVQPLRRDSSLYCDEKQLLKYNARH